MSENKPADKQELKPPTNIVPCCGYADNGTIGYPVYWNEFNKVVQCHNCGHIYEPKDYGLPSNVTEQHKLRETFREHMDAAVQLGVISEGYANYACDVLQNCVVSSAQIPSLAAPESETEEWTIIDGSVRDLHGKRIGWATEPNEKRLVDAHNAAIARLQQRIKELEEGYAGLQRAGILS